MPDHENGQAAAEASRFSLSSTIIFSDLDLEGLTQERLRSNIFAESTLLLSAHNKRFRTIGCEVRSLKEISCSTRPLPRFPMSREHGRAQQTALKPLTFRCTV